MRGRVFDGRPRRHRQVVVKNASGPFVARVGARTVEIRLMVNAWPALDPGRRATDRTRDLSPALVSHRSAASLHRLGDLDADVHEFTTADRKQSRRPDVRLHRGYLAAGEWTVVNALRSPLSRARSQTSPDRRLTAATSPALCATPSP